LSVREGTRDSGLDLVTKAVLLGGQINKGDHGADSRSSFAPTKV
jgi:hypothetical protein